MSGGDIRDRIGRFRGDAVRDRWLADYDEAIRRLPVPTTALDVPTRFGSTRLYRCGPAVGTPILLFTGFGGCALGWDYSVGPLSGSHPVYLVDPIGGAGRSVQTAPLHGADDLATWLVEVLDGIGAPTAHLVGFSYGGWYTAHTARRAPDRVASLTMLDPAGFARIGVRHYAWGIPVGLAILSPPVIRRRAARWLHTPSINWADELMVALKGPQTYRNRLPKMQPFTDAELRAIRTPTLLILGENSSIHRSHQVKRRVEALMPSVRVDLVADTGHSLALDRPDVVNQRLLEFLAATPPRSVTPR